MKDGYWQEIWTREAHTSTFNECLRDNGVLPLVFRRCETHEFTRPNETTITFHMICSFGQGPRYAVESTGVVSGDLARNFTVDERSVSSFAGVGVSHKEFHYLGPQCPSSA